jgi:tetratricopeptide (TPR) repeat protein
MKSIRINLLVLTLTNLVLCGCQTAHTSDAMPVPVMETVSAPIAKVPANETIRFLEDRIRRDPEDHVAHNKLASEYLQRLRETGDITYLELANRSAAASLNILPAEQNKGALAALIQVQIAAHEFASVPDKAKSLIELDPGKGYPYQFQGDAFVELGKYDEAESAFKQFENLGSSQGLTRVAVEQRHARMALLRGDNARAISHFAAALRVANAMPDPPRETVAWCQWQLGETAFGDGNMRAAETFFRDALKTLPDHYRSLASLGRARAAQGRISEAIELYEKVVRILPDPGYVASLGDLYKITGRADEAQKQYALVETIGRLSELSGTLYNRQLALFYADHDLKPDEAYRQAAAEYEGRRDIYGADALAWTALKAGKTEEAQAAMRDALKLGTRDAKLLYHAGMIENAAGNASEAKRLLTLALKTNRGFDPLQAAAAKSALDALN